MLDVESLQRLWARAKYTTGKKYGKFVISAISCIFVECAGCFYGSAEGPPRGVENRNLLSHPDDLRMEVYVIRMT